MSVFSSSPNGAETKTLLNVIMRQMFSRADLIDLYSLADPQRCSKYIVVAAKALEKLFLTINLEPRRGSDGKIYFQKIEGLQRANPMKGEQDLTCKLLSFFFIRIFRIYGALTLSILDSDIPNEDPRIVTKNFPKGRGLVVINPPHLQGFKQKEAGVSWFGTGGELTNYAFAAPGAPGGGSGNYYFTEDGNGGAYKELLNKYLLMPSGANPATSRSAMRFQGVESLVIPQETLYDIVIPPNPGGAAAPPPIQRTVKDFTSPDIENRPRPIILYNFKRGEKYVSMTARLFITTDGDGNGYDVTLENIEFTAETGKAGRKTLSDKLRKRWPTDNEPISKTQKNLPALIQELFVKAADQIDPPAFSLVEFLKKFNIIDSYEGAIRLKETTITISVSEEMRRETYIPIKYVGKYKLDGQREVKVEIGVDIFGTRIKKIINKNQEYAIGIDIESMETEPDGLRSLIINAMAERVKQVSSTFSTGISDTEVPKDGKGRTIPQFLQNTFERLLAGLTGGQSTGGIEYDREGRPKPYDSTDMPDEYRVKSLWEALAKDPPLKPHCIARAVQLLNIAAIRDPGSGEAYSSICNTKFPYIVDKALPTPGQSVVTSESVKSLAMLFVDQVVGALPKVTNTEQFKIFRERLKTSFQRYDSVEQMRANLPTEAAALTANARAKDPAAPEQNPLDFKYITEKQMPFCEGNQDKKLKLEGAIVGHLRTKVNELRRQQYNHISRAMQLMFRLFNEKAIRAGNFEINDYILANGMDALNKLAEDARTLLIEYYSNCEQTYKEGLAEIYQTRGVGVTPVPA